MLAACNSWGRMKNNKTATDAKRFSTNVMMALFLSLSLSTLFGSDKVFAQQPTPSATPPPAREEEPPADLGEEVIRVSSNLVVVPVSVIDSTGNPVKGLKLQDFRLEEEGRPQELAQLGDPDQVPLDIALLFDLSSSVKGRFGFQQQAAARFLKEVLKPGDSATVFSIGMFPKMVQARGGVDQAVATVMAFTAATQATPTAFYDTVNAAADYLAKNAPKDHRKVILVISDGDDNFSKSIKDAAVADYDSKQATADVNSFKAARSSANIGLNQLHQRAQLDVQPEVQRADTVFYSINPAGESIRLNVISMRANNGMQSIAEATGGSAFLPNKDEDLERVFRQIAAELRAQYLLQYYSSEDTPAGKFMRLKVSVPSQPQVKVKSRLGYYTKKNK